MVRPENEEVQIELLEPPSVVQRRLRARIGEMVAAQAVEDELGLQVPRGQGLYHRYNAVLKRVLGNKGRAEMTLAELEAALAWLERNRLLDHLHVLEGDARYAGTAAIRRRWPWTESEPRLDSGRRHPRGNRQSQVTGSASSSTGASLRDSTSAARAQDDSAM